MVARVGDDFAVTVAAMAGKPGKDRGCVQLSRREPGTRGAESVVAAVAFYRGIDGIEQGDELSLGQRKGVSRRVALRGFPLCLQLALILVHGEHASAQRTGVEPQ